MIPGCRSRSVLPQSQGLRLSLFRAIRLSAICVGCGGGTDHSHDYCGIVPPKSMNNPYSRDDPKEQEEYDQRQKGYSQSEYGWTPIALTSWRD